MAVADFPENVLFFVRLAKRTQNGQNQVFLTFHFCHYFLLEVM